MMRFLSGGPKKGDQKKKPESAADDAEGKVVAFRSLMAAS